MKNKHSFLFFPPIFYVLFSPWRKYVLFTYYLRIIFSLNRHVQQISMYLVFVKPKISGPAGASSQELHQSTRNPAYVQNPNYLLSQDPDVSARNIKPLSTISFAGIF